MNDVIRSADLVIAQTKEQSIKNALAVFEAEHGISHESRHRERSAMKHGRNTNHKSWR
ncbi:MAG: hypothetical protein NC089_02955 [Bacteroides sp.]|nr:hypothetical protein [Bacteroides sp.]MCM1550518.1 hypothetical protein [Clostridium sp.]